MFQIITARLILIGYLAFVGSVYIWSFLGILEEALIALNFNIVRGYMILLYVILICLFRYIEKWIWRKYFVYRKNDLIIVGNCITKCKYYHAFQTHISNSDLAFPTPILVAIRELNSQELVMPNVKEVFLRFPLLRVILHPHRMVYPGEIFIPFENILYGPRDTSHATQYVFRTEWKNETLEILLSVENRVLLPTNFGGMQTYNSQQWDWINVAFDEYISQMSQSRGVTAYHAVAYLNLFLQSKFVEHLKEHGITSRFTPIKMQLGNEIPLYF